MMSNKKAGIKQPAAATIRDRGPAREDPQRRARRATPERARPPSSRRCSPPPGTIPRAGTVAEGTHGQRPRPGGGRAAALGRALGLPDCAGTTWSINLLDTPGYPDFTGELRAGLRAADAALFVVSAADDIDPITVSLWEECAALGTPRAVVITKLDAPRADYPGTLAACQRLFGGERRPGRAAAVRAGRRRSGEAPHGLVGLLSRSGYDYRRRLPAGGVGRAGGRCRRRRAARRADRGDHQQQRGRDAARPLPRPARRSASRCWSTTSRPPSRAARSTRCCRCAPAPASAWPSCSRCSPARSRRRSSSTRPRSTGVDGSPAKAVSTATRRASCSPRSSAPRSTRTSAGCRSCALFSGTLTPETRDAHLRARRRRPRPPRPRRRRAGRPAVLPARRHAAPGRAGRRRRHLRHRPAGHRRDRRHPVGEGRARCSSTPWEMPEPLLPIAVQAATRADEDALAKALGRLTAGDPTVRVERHADTGQLVLWCLGEAHADVVLERLRGHRGARRHRAAAHRAARDVHRRGARARPAGQAVRRPRAVRRVRRRRRPRCRAGSGVQFAEKVVGGAVPSQFIGSVEKGVRAQLEQGLDNDHIPVVDVLRHPRRRQGAQRRLLRRGLPDRRCPGGEGRRRPAAGRRCSSRIAAVDDHRPGRARGRGDVGPVRPARPGHRHRAGPDRDGGHGAHRRPRRGARTPSWSATPTTLRSLTAGTGRFTRELRRATTSCRPPWPSAALARG